VTDSCSPGDKSVTPDDDTGSDAPRDGRTARLARDSDGDPLGAAVFFDAEDLRALGVHPDATDANRVSYAVKNGHLVLDADAYEGGER